MLRSDDERAHRFPRDRDELNSIVVVTNPGGVLAEAVRSLRTRIMAQHVQTGRRALAICAATEGAGASFVAANLAVALAQIGIRTALVDSDLRNPTLDEMLGVERHTPGLADCLTDQQLQLHDLMQEHVMPCLSYISSGSSSASPQELLATERFASFTDLVLREHQITIFDTTAANGCTDAQRVATVAGYSLVVARKNSSFMSDLTTLSKLLRADGSKVVGSVLVDS
jgi:capsular exopolysaccharide synthesis family protein